MTRGNGPDAQRQEGNEKIATSEQKLAAEAVQTEADNSAFVHDLASPAVMSAEKIKQSLAVPDLSDPRNGPHAINLAVDALVRHLSATEGYPEVQIYRKDPICSVADNFDRLQFPADNLSRSSRYTRYVTDDMLLRTHTSEMMPDILREAAQSGVEDRIFVCPGICFRRDVVDKTHTGEPHQIDIWRLKRGEPRLEREALLDLVRTTIDSLLPGYEFRANEVTHPYTINGLEIEILVKGEWLELLECGEIHPQLLIDAGLNPEEYSGLASGMGLDRLVMVTKGIDDIRILRSEDPRIKQQMLELKPYKAVSKFPGVRQDISVAVDKEMAEEDLCEAIRDAAGQDMKWIEEVQVLSDTPFEDLPPQAIERLGVREGQKNLLIRMMIRSPEKTMLKQEANDIRDRIYRALHQGDKGYIQ